ncbi:MAG: helix-turn-helix domain-containing protein [Planctomycetota bacterium]|nr:helix-turn-helix domain-containing protein [Planctomycetota bacterium]
MNRLLTTRQISERCSVSLGTVKKWVREGRLPVIRLGPTGPGRRPPVRVREEALEAFLRDHECPPVDDEVRRILG